MLDRKCRIMYISPVLQDVLYTQDRQHSQTKSIIWKLIKGVGIGLLIALFLVEIWALTWFLCAIDDVCYAANAPRL